MRIDAVANEKVLGNQDGDGEQENIDYFQATPPGPTGAPQYKQSFTLRNDDTLHAKHFRLTYDPKVPAGWKVAVNGGKLDLDLAAGAARTIPVTITPGGPKPPAGKAYWVDIDAEYVRELINPTLPPGQRKHLEFRPLGGVRIDARTVIPVTVKCHGVRSGNAVRVNGVLSTPKRPRGLTVMVQGVRVSSTSPRRAHSPPSTRRRARSPRP